MFYKHKYSLKQLFIFLLTFVSISEAYEKPGFLATFPSNVLPNNDAKFCIQFFNLKSNVNLTVSDSNPETFKPFYIHYTINDKQICKDVKIVELKESADAKKIKIEGATEDQSYNFSDEKTFFYKAITTFNLIETDKPVYKPGQKVKIRILSVDLNLKPVEKEFKEIYIQDASTSRINQWLNVKSSGLIELEMPLSEEPNLGIWKIIVIENDSNDPNQIEFEVKKYVLPKFEVTMNHYEKIQLDEKSVNVTVCAKYTYGKNVAGTFELKAYTKKFSFKTYEEEEFKNVVISKKAKGCHTFEINTESIGINKDQYIYKVYFESKVTESDTDLQMNSSSTMVITYESIDIVKLEPEYYKPGLPIYFKIAIKKVRGDKFPNQEVTIELEQKNKIFYESKYVSDENGMIEFELDCNKQNCDKIFSQISSKSPSTISLKVSSKVGDVIPGFEWINNPKKVFAIYPWNSKKLSYLQMYKNSDSSKCGDEMNVRMRIRSTNNLDNLYFEMQSRSTIVSYGYFNLESNQSSSNDYSFELNNSNIFDINVINNKIEKDKRCFNFNEANQSNKSNQQENYDYYRYYPRYWFFNNEKNECYLEKPTSESYKDYFYSKDDCEDACKPSNFSFSPTGIASVMDGFKYKKFYDYTIDLKFKITPEMTPELKILAFFVHEDEIIPDSLSLNLLKCLNNKVSLNVDENEVQVGQKVGIKIKTEPKSICAVSAIDKSVTLMGNRNSINLERIFDKMKQFNLIYDYLNVYKGSEECITPQEPIYDYPQIPIPRPSITQTRKARSYPYFSFSKFYESSKAFRSSSVIYLSDLNIFKECKRSSLPRPHYLAMPRSNMLGRMQSNIVLASSLEMDQAPQPQILEKTSPNVVSELIKTIRTNFPETWLFQIDLADENGLIDKKTTAPDTITDWILDAYCLSNKTGLGIGEQKTIRVFQSLFVSVDLPYSVIRGETFPVKASVFNYENTCIPINIEMLPEKKIIFGGKSVTKSFQKCICPDEKITETFYLKAVSFDYEKGFKISARVSSLNSTSVCENENKTVSKLIKFMDLESKTILVEPEGIPKEHVESFLTVFKTNQIISNQSFEIKLPENIVPKSSRAFISITGDALGPVLNNLDHLVQQPTGCGEQNMVKFAPIVYVTDYLKLTSQLTSQLDKQTKEYLKIGYQRQLTYRHSDGSFSAFGPKNSETGGTWLTAFVLRCFAECYDSNHIEIDQNDILTSYKQLLVRQTKDGSFSQIGAQLFSKALAGGLKDEKIGLSAYVLISLLKSLKAIKPNKDDYARIKLGLDYLKSSLDDVTNSDLYSLALGLYAFKLAEIDPDFVLKLENELSKREINKNGFLYWSESNGLKKSADLEITSYVLLSKLHGLKKQDIDKVVQISKWINSQRNSLGGFYSTQDTVVALSALSKFASLFYSKATNMQISYDYLENNTTLVQINSKNRLLIQKKRLIDFNENELNKVTYNVKGQGTALVQLIVKYNLANESALKVKNDYEFGLLAFESHLGSKCSYAKLKINSKYSGNNDKSDMSIISVKLPSGWIVIEETVEKLKESNSLRRFEISNENRLFLYFDEISKEGIEFDFHVSKKFDVIDRKPGLISVYDYYENFDENVSYQFEINDNCK